MTSVKDPPKSAGIAAKGQTAQDPRSKAFLEMSGNRVAQQMDYLRRNGPGTRSLEYFYSGFQNLNTQRLEEIRAAKAQGKKVIGYLCNFVPIELILAADAIPLSLNTGYSETILPAEEILPRNFCPLIKSSFGSVIEKSPLFGLVDVVIIPTSCDGKKKLGELLSDHVPVWIMEVPHTTNTRQSRWLWLNEIKNLKKQLQKFTGNRISNGKIRKAIAVLNEQRAQVHRLYNLRKGPPPIWGRDALLVTNYAQYDDPERWNQQVELLNNELEKAAPVGGKDHRPRILLTGTPLAVPSWKIPVLIEESGGVIVTDDICTGTKGMWDPVETSAWTGSDLLVSLADRYLMNTCACFTPNNARIVRLKRFVEDWKIDGVIYYVIMACHTYGMEQRRINHEMEDMNIPVLNIETDFSQEDIEQIRTRLEAFMELIRTRHALKTGTVLDKQLHPKGHAMNGPQPSMTQEQVVQTIADTAAKTQSGPRSMDFPVSEAKGERESAMSGTALRPPDPAKKKEAKISR